MNIVKNKYIEEIIEIEGDSFIEVSDKVIDYMKMGYSPLLVKRHEYESFRWVGGAIKRTRIE